MPSRPQGPHAPLAERESERPATSGWRRAIFGAATGDAAAPAALVLALYYAALVPAHWLRMPHPARISIAGLAALSSIVFLGLAIRWRWFTRLDSQSRVVTTLAAIVLLNNANVMWQLPGTEYATGFYLVLAAFGVLDLTWRAFGGLVAALLSTYSLGPIRGGLGAEWGDPTLLLAATGVFALVVRLYRSRAQARFEAARVESERQRLAAEQGLVALQREIAHRERLQERLARAERLESLALLAGGIAHDFNNLMAVVIGNASLALGRAPAADLRMDLDAILEAGDRATLLAKSLLAYAGRGVRSVVAIDLAREAASIANLAPSFLPAGVTLQVVHEAQEVYVAADRAQLQQVVLNLIMNAAEASASEGGVIRVSAGRSRLDAEAASQLEPLAERAAGDYAFLSVADQGGGMGEETLKHVFDPFFTTKPGGSGLGLAAALGIARVHGGGFRVSSEPGRGSEFTLLLPLSAERPLPRAAPPARSSAGRAGAILVVDDQESVRRTIARTLSATGFAVVEAGGGSEAAQLLRAGASAIAAALVDMSMPELDGEQTLYALRTIRPDLPVLLSSGYDVHAIAERLTDLPGVDFLAKPYRAEELVERIERLIEAQL